MKIKYEVTQVAYNEYIVEATRSCGSGAAMELQSIEATLIKELAGIPNRNEHWIWTAVMPSGVVLQHQDIKTLVAWVKGELKAEMVGGDWLTYSFEF